MLLCLYINDIIYEPISIHWFNFNINTCIMFTSNNNYEHDSTVYHFHRNFSRAQRTRRRPPRRM